MQLVVIIKNSNGVKDGSIGIIGKSHWLYPEWKMFGENKEMAQSGGTFVHYSCYISLRDFFEKYA